MLGYDLMNEPWPGSEYEACFTGCPELELARLGAFGERMAAAIRSVDPVRLVFSEPWMLFNFGFTSTALSGIGAPASALSFHVYAARPELDEAVVENAIAVSVRGDALLITEFGATGDVAKLDRLTNAFDVRLVPWVFWTWDEKSSATRRSRRRPATSAGSRRGAGAAVRVGDQRHAAELRLRPGDARARVRVEHHPSRRRRRSGRAADDDRAAAERLRRGLERRRERRARAVRAVHARHRGVQRRRGGAGDGAGRAGHGLRRLRRASSARRS
ncbi:MAG: glycoside hydrolase family 5 protein [Deltaproteobacteria bacterium]|nr:glycoside hydrolase family 5 protein [Deltaproteobacteria bacterium]